jgi:hypothetical protein
MPFNSEDCDNTAGCGEYDQLAAVGFVSLQVQPSEFPSRTTAAFGFLSQPYFEAIERQENDIVWFGTTNETNSKSYSTVRYETFFRQQPNKNRHRAHP